ncbi:MAG: hypothetical protein V4560_01745 [Bacteroidota bacterium]
MKVLVLTFGMLVSIITVKAQQNSLPDLNKVKPDTSYRTTYRADFGWPTINVNIPVSNLGKGVVATKITDHMPVAKLSNTDPGMPIVKTDKTGYTTPVAGMSLPPVYNMQKQNVVVVTRP